MTFSSTYISSKIEQSILVKTNNNYIKKYLKLKPLFVFYKSAIDQGAFKYDNLGVVFYNFLHMAKTKKNTMCKILAEFFFGGKTSDLLSPLQLKMLRI